MNKTNNEIYHNDGVFRIGIDCDDTIMVFLREYWDIHNKKYNENVKWYKCFKWGFDNFTKIGFQATIDTLYTKGLYRNLRLRRGTRQLMKMLLENDFSIYLITDLPPAKGDVNPTKDREENIKDRLPWFDLSKYVITGEKDKTGLGLLVLLDDKEETYYKFIEQGKNIILMDAPHNRHIKNVKYRATSPMAAIPMILEIRENYLKEMNQ